MATLTEKIKTELENICQRITDAIENPNYGGCGIIAERLYLWLTTKGVNAKIVVLSYDPEIISEVVKNNELNRRFGLGHIVVKLEDGQFVDSEGVSPIENKMCRNYPQSEIPLNILVAMNIRTQGWNPTFDRDQIPQLDQLVFAGQCT